MVKRAWQAPRVAPFSGAREGAAACGFPLSPQQALVCAARKAQPVSQQPWLILLYLSDRRDLVEIFFSLAFLQLPSAGAAEGLQPVAP